MDGKQKVALTFALYKGDALLRREVVTQEVIKLGGDPKCHVRFDDAAAPNPFAAVPNPFASAADPFHDSNPFAQPAPVLDEVPADAPEGSYTYTLIKSGPDLPAEAVEAQAASVEVMILWEKAVLHVAHLTPPRSFYLGEEQGRTSKCDYFLPSEKLGVRRAPLVLADGGSVAVVLLPGAEGTLETPGQAAVTVEEAIASGRAQPCAELPGAYQVTLSDGAKAKIELRGIGFQVSAVRAGRVVAGHVQVDTQSLLFTGLSSALHLGLLAAMAFFMPPLGATDTDAISAEQAYLMQQYIQARAEQEQEARETEQMADEHADEREGGRTLADSGSVTRTACGAARACKAGWRCGS